MKEENKEKGKGWHEKIDQMCIGKDGEPKARKHHEVALRKEFEKQGFTGATKISPKEDIISVSFNVEKKDIPEFNKATEEFMEENDIEVETEAKGDKVNVKIAVESLEAFVNHLDNKYKLDSDEKEQVEAILEKDSAKTAKGDSDNKSNSKNIDADKLSCPRRNQMVSKCETLEEVC